jgi:lipoprotein-anchoring transpeptidase ErfK/SrfK
LSRALFAAIFLLATASAAAAEPPVPLRSAPSASSVLPARVRIAGVRVGGMTTSAATQVVRQAFAQPLTVVVDKRSFSLRPPRLATAYVDDAVRRAAAADAGAQISLAVSAHGAAIRDVVARLARRVEHRASTSDMALRLRDGKPWISPNAFGRELDTTDILQRVVHELTANTRRPMHFATTTVEPRALAAASDRVIVIDRGKNMLTLYNGTKLWHEFRVATGQSAYPTPAGRFHIVVKWKDPWWYPPNDPWAAGESPTPPGPNNPLGTRWMGLSAPGVGIHGTPQPQSIGYSLSHGCIRMLIPQAEWLFDHVDVGTTVFIV